MRFLHRNTPRHSDEALSVASLTSSTGSYEVFGSACSDYSECEFCEDRRQRRSRRNTTSAQSPGTSHSYRSAMDQNPELTESAPLLNTAPRHSQYSSVSSSDSLGPADLSTKAILATYRKLENQKKPELKKQSSLVTIFSIWNTTLGSSLLTMAWGVERAGLLTGLLLLIVMGGLCLFTAGLLLSVNRHHGGATCEVPFLCRTLLGPWAEKLAHAFSLLVLLGANVVYWILITNFLYYTVNYFMDISSGATYNGTISCASNASILSPPAQDAPAAPAYWRLHATVPLYVAAIIFPLLNFKNATFFTKFNSLGTLSVFYLLLFVTVKGWVWGINVDRSLITVHAGKEAAVLSGMLALSFYIHNILITIMNNNENQDNNGRDLTIAFVLITLTYMLVGCVFYVCFPLIKTCIEDNILNNFEMHDIMTAVARMLLLFQVITVFPLVAFMLRTEAILLLPLNEELKTKRRTTIVVNIVIVLICILFACFCPNIGTIIRYTGAAGGLIHIFTLPSLLQLRSLQLRGQLTCWKTVLYCTILLVGPVNLLLQFIVDE